ELACITQVKGGGGGEGFGDRADAKHGVFVDGATGVGALAVAAAPYELIADDDAGDEGRGAFAGRGLFVAQHGVELADGGEHAVGAMGVVEARGRRRGELLGHRWWRRGDRCRGWGRRRFWRGGGWA